MLVKHPNSTPTLTEAVWIDLLNATEAELAEVAGATGLRLPGKEDIEEIESSSRVYVDGEALYLSSPMLTGDDCLTDGLTTIGFVLTPQRLVTIRFAPVAAFDAVRERYGQVSKPAAADAFLTLLETVVDHAADALERAGAELDGISRAAFRAERPPGKHARMSEELRAALRKLGRMSDGISHLRDTLLGLGRIGAFVHETSRETHLTGVLARLNAIRGDIASLNDYQAHLSAKVQFLLDATLGFISIQQNDIVKTLTIVSVVGVPPVLIAGVYGMNFRYMPELGWPLGYPFALALIVASGLLPLGWLKWRGWM
jgi:magnesium transporter